ncbi:MAG: molybdenum cofactor biosynthesis protein MoaE [Deltaproteobacteria bacterium]|nr:MAG: molybdenum cofactor biosynthesis protein MoaE [Deltaproteobacteria bacterium]
MSPRHLSAEPLDLDALLAETAGVDAGAVVVFAGDVRAQEPQGSIVALDYDVHPGLAERALARIERDLLTSQGVLAVRIVHRVGRVPAGETAVISVVRARHRREAFEACERSIERLKREVAIWKVDVRPDGAREISDTGQPIQAPED